MKHWSSLEVEHMEFRHIVRAMNDAELRASNAEELLRERLKLVEELAKALAKASDTLYEEGFAIDGAEADVALDVYRKHTTPKATLPGENLTVSPLNESEAIGPKVDAAATEPSNCPQKFDHMHMIEHD